MSEWSQEEEEEAVRARVLAALPASRSWFSDVESSPILPKL